MLTAHMPSSRTARVRMISATVALEIADYSVRNARSECAVLYGRRAPPQLPVSVWRQAGLQDGGAGLSVCR